MRVLVELVHIAAGIMAALAIAALSAWAVPGARREIWIVDYVAIAFILGMGIKPLMAARAADVADKVESKR